VKDRVCLSSNASCTSTSFPFVSVKSETNLDPALSGIIGLTLGSKLVKGISVGDKFIDYLFAGSAIAEKKFSTHIGTTSSYIDFGTPNPASMSSLSDLVSVKVRNGFFWSGIVEAIRLGASNKDSTEYVTDPLYAIFSTSSAISLVPQYIVEDFFNRLLVNVKHKVI